MVLYVLTEPPRSVELIPLVRPVRLPPAATVKPPANSRLPSLSPRSPRSPSVPSIAPPAKPERHLRISTSVAEPSPRQAEPHPAPPSSRESGRPYPSSLDPLSFDYSDFEITKGPISIARSNSTGLAYVIKVLTGADPRIFFDEVPKVYHATNGTLLHFHGFSDSPPAVFYDIAPNGSLADLLANPPPAWDATRQWIVLYGLAKGMAWLHSRRIMHRNLKPSNVLLDDQLRPLIGDVGFTRSYNRAFAYMAPELLSGAQYKSKVDVFAYGMIVFAVLTGQDPFAGEDPEKVKAAILRCERPIIPDSVPLGFACLIRDCLSQEPGARPTFEAILNDFAVGSLQLPGTNAAAIGEYIRTYAPANEAESLVERLRESAECGDVNDLYTVARCYLRGIGVKVTGKEAMRYLQMASELGLADAQFDCAYLMLRFRKDSGKMMRYLKMAADNGQVNAQILMAKLAPSREEAIKWLEGAAAQGHVTALLGLAFKLQKTDPDDAAALFKRAAEAGSPTAQSHYAICLHSGQGATGANMAEANQYYRAAADAGDVRAQCNLAFNLQRGDGIEKDVAEANRYYRQAADSGYANAQANYAYNLMNGIGLPKDMKAATRYYEMAADQGHLGAQFSFACNLMRGEGVPQDLARANELLKLAADRGHALAQVQYGMNLLNGTGLRQNPEQATHYFRLAAEQGNPRAQCSYGFALQNGTGIQEDKQDANRYFRLAADHGNALAQYTLGFNLENGIGIAKDLPEANKLYRLAADQGNANAQLCLAMNLLRAPPAAQNLDEANKYLKAASDQGLARAQYQYALHVQKGIGVPKDQGAANTLFKASADQGCVMAQFYYGYNLFNGLGIEKNQTEAARYYKLAADGGNPNAQCNLACSYQNGVGVAKDLPMAAKYYRMSADAGNTVAQYNYGMHLMTGTLGEPNPTEANRYFKLAADQNNANAQFYLGINLLTGKGIAQDAEEGKRLLKLSAAAGQPKAQAALAKLH
jgi:TPR repeat protein